MTAFCEKILGGCLPKWYWLLGKETAKAKSDQLFSAHFGRFLAKSTHLML